MSDLLPPIENFDELRSVARTIDEGLNFLEKKCENVVNLGLSLDPRKTKKLGEDILDELADEIEEMKQDVDSVCRSLEECLQCRIADNEQISAFTEQLTNELQDMENQLAAKGNYVPMVQKNDQELETDITDLREITSSSMQLSFSEPRRTIRRPETPENRKLHSTQLSVNITNVMNTLNTSDDQFLSPMCARQETCRRGRNSARKDCGTSYDFDNKSILSEYCESTSNSLAMLEKRLNHTDDLVKTPVDPGVSVITMQLLGKSNLKTKVYKENVANFSHLTRSPY